MFYLMKYRFSILALVHIFVEALLLERLDPHGQQTHQQDFSRRYSSLISYFLNVSYLKQDLLQER